MRPPIRVLHKGHEQLGCSSEPSYAMLPGLTAICLLAAVHPLLLSSPGSEPSQVGEPKQPCCTYHGCLMHAALLSLGCDAGQGKRTKNTSLSKS